MAPSPADPRGAAMDADENEDAWRVGGFRVAGVRSKVFAPPPGHPRRSAQGFLVSMERDDHTSAPSSPMRVAPAASQSTARCASSSPVTPRCTARRSGSPPARRERR